MNRKTFDRLEVKDQVKHINSLLHEGYSFNKACKKVIHIPTSTVRDRFKTNGYAYKKAENAYVKISDTEVLPETTEKIVMTPNSDTPITPIEKHDMLQEELNNNTNNITPIKKIGIHQEHTDVTDVVLNEEIKELFQLKDRLLNMLEWYETKKDIVDIPELKIDSDILTGEVVTRSFKVHKDVLDRFVKYCKKHKAYTQRDLLSLAITEFLNKYER